jgi:hypothetical protein
MKEQITLITDELIEIPIGIHIWINGVTNRRPLFLRASTPKLETNVFNRATYVDESKSTKREKSGLTILLIRVLKFFILKLNFSSVMVVCTSLGPGFWL